MSSAPAWAVAAREAEFRGEEERDTPRGDPCLRDSEPRARGDTPINHEEDHRNPRGRNAPSEAVGSVSFALRSLGWS